MKNSLVLALVLVLLAGAYWAGSRRGRQEAPVVDAQQVHRILYYVDPMNPAHTSSQPGKAPCGMDMEPVYADALTGTPAGDGSSGLPPGTVKITPEKQQLIGLRLSMAEKKPLQHRLRLLGKVALDETRIYRINATIDGWITKALPFAAGSYVKKDQTLATFYSPEFLAAGQALVFAVTSAERVKTTGQENEVQRSQMANFDLNIRQYRDTLRNLGMGEVQIDELVRTRKLMENINVTAPADGFIVNRNVSDGQRFERGKELFSIADLSHVWVLVDVFERDAGLVQAEQPVTVRLANQDRTFIATVSKSLPQFDNVTRTLKLRLETDNPDFALKPDVFVDVDLPISLPESIVVPVEAVLDAGLRQTVFVARGNGYFEPRQVQLGARVGEQVQVLAGLKPDEPIVIAGNFLIDSESRMKLAAAELQSAQGTDPVCGMAVDEDKARGAGRTSDYQGRAFYFCNEGCKRKFDADPAKYVSASGAQASNGTNPNGPAHRD